MRRQLRDELYENQKIALDGTSWWACSFKECELLIDTGDLSLDYCTFNNCKLVLGEKAATVAKVIQMFNPGLQIAEREV